MISLLNGTGFLTGLDWRTFSRTVMYTHNLASKMLSRVIVKLISCHSNKESKFFGNIMLLFLLGLVFCSTRFRFINNKHVSRYTSHFNNQLFSKRFSLQDFRLLNGVFKCFSYILNLFLEKKLFSITYSYIRNQRNTGPVLLHIRVSKMIPSVTTN